MDLNLVGVHVLITGANGGIGFETTKVFLEQGAFVTAHYRSSNAALLPLTASYDATRLRLLQADLTSESAVATLFAAAAVPSDSSNISATTPGPVEVLVVNHAIDNSAAPLTAISLDRWQRTLENNLTSPFLVVREYMRALEAGVAQSKAQPGSGDAGVEGRRFGDRAAVVFVGSTAGRFGEAGNADYAASKSGMMYGLTLSLKNEIVRIAPLARVNCVAPGYVRTPQSEIILADPAVAYRALATIPLKKIAVPSDVARQVAVVASARVSGHVSGEVILVAGGMEGRLLNRARDVGLNIDGC